jgi:squalene synthase HpnC
VTVDEHYENFPVASVLVPGAIRPFVVAIYRFARHADDVADEGDARPDERLATLSALDEDVVRLFDGGEARAPTVRGLAAIRDAGYVAITEQPFRDLIDAFRQDLTVQRYESYEQLLDYCRRSANPVGRLMLALAGVSEPRALAASDDICSSLQLINFWQDAAIDASRGRIYVPTAEFAKHKTSSDQFPSYPLHQALMHAQCERARTLLLSGSPLLSRLSGRFRLEIAITMGGGLRILDKIAANDWDVTKRPKLRWYDSFHVLCHAIRVWFRAHRQRAI